MNCNNVPYTFQAGGGQLSFGNKGSSVTWNPPIPTGPGTEDQDDVPQGHNHKRRRVQVDMDDLGVAILKLGSDMTFDFKSTHAEAEKKLADITTERDHLREQLSMTGQQRDGFKNQLQDTLARQDQAERSRMSELEKQLARMTQLEEQFAHMRQERDEFEKALQQAKQTHGEEIEAEKQGRSNLTDALDESRRETAALNTIVDQSLRKVEILERQLGLSRNEMKDAQTQLADTQKALTTANEKLDNEVKKTRSAGFSKITKISQLVGVRNGTSTSQLQNPPSTPTKQASPRDDHLQRGSPTVNELLRLQEKISELERDNKMKDHECDRLKRELAEKAFQVFHIGNRNTELNDTISELEGKMQGLDEQIKDLMEENLNLSIEMDEVQRSNNDLDDTFYSSPKSARKRTPKKPKK